MTIEQVTDMLEATGFPVAYEQWPEGAAPEMPYIVYLSPYTNNFAADGTAYFIVNHVQIELYTKLKDQEAEAKVESALASFYWEKTESYINTEKCYQILYEIEV